ncbi:flocculation protein FLO11-like [Haliotis rufescens]|uniref:flocculation protein FLO11-like n=1 Tax=Haliotis rufescens TaxID=6454 RepID=UPI00201F6612|nr:flocculation protein FLO11-like [Haliotis rufescens]
MMQREVITRQMLDLVRTVQGITESSIEDAVSVLSSPSTDTSLPSPDPATDTSLPSPDPATDTSLPSPDPVTDTSLPSPAPFTDSSLPSPESATDTSLPSPDPVTDTSLPSPESATDTSLPSPDPATDSSLPSPDPVTDTSLPSPDPVMYSSLLSPDPVTDTSPPSQVLVFDLEPSVSSPPLSSRGDLATLVNTAPMTPASNDHPTVSATTPSCMKEGPLTPTTGILPFFKLAGQKIAGLNQMSSPCKNTCPYHAQRRKGLKFQPSHENETDALTDRNDKQIPMNERVTLPPRQATDEVTTHPSTPPSSILTCKPFLCSNSFTPNKAPVTDASQATSVRKAGTTVPKSRHPPSPLAASASQSHTFQTWKASFMKAHTPKQKMLKVKPFQMTPDMRTLNKDSWRKPLMQDVMESDETTVPHEHESTRHRSKATEDSPKTRNMSSQLPWRLASKSKSLLQPFGASPLSQSSPALCSVILASVVARPGSCRDPETIRERTRNANILMMNESEEGENSFGSGFWDLRTTMPDSQNKETVTDNDIHEGNTKSVAFPSTLPLPLSDNSVPDASPTFESAKRKLFYNENRTVPLKKRFNPNFSELARDHTPHKTSASQGKPCTPHGKSTSPKKKSGIHGKPNTPKKKSGVPGKPNTPKKKSGVHEKPNTPKKKSGVCGKQVTPHRKYQERKSCIEETSRTSRARLPIQSASLEEESVLQLEEMLTAFMTGRKQATTKILPPAKQNQLIEFAGLCYISATRTAGGVRLRKTSASRAPIPLDREWMLS